MQIRRDTELSSEIPMGPLIDIVFLLLVFFLVSAKPIKPESDVGLSLPGTVSQEEALVMPDEQRVVILPGGQVTLNESPVDASDARELPALVTVLKRLKELSEANRTDALVTLDAKDGVKHQRIVDVLNACATAGIRGVTFAADEQPEESF